MVMGLLHKIFQGMVKAKIGFQQLGRVTVLVVGMLLFVGEVAGQTVSQYIFSASSGTYSGLNNTYTITRSGGSNDDGYYNNIPIGFTFRFCGNDYTTIHASTNGWMALGGTALNNALYTNDLSGITRPVIAPLWDDLDMSSGELRSNTSGTSPNRVFTIEWRRAEWNYNADSRVISVIAKLYETTNVIEFIYQQEPNNVLNGSATIGIADGVSGSGHFLSLDGTGTSPSASSTVETSNLNIKPATGQVYTFTPLTAVTYYSINNNPVNSFTSWWTNTDGTGSNPTNFTSGDIFIVQSGHNMTTTGTWSVSGTNSTVQISNNASITETNNITLSANTTLLIDDGGTLNHNVNSTSVFGGTETFGNTSIINYGYAGAQTVLSATYGNLTISGSGIKSLSGNTTVNSNLTLTSGTLAVGANTLTLNGPAIAGTPTNLSTTAASGLNFGGSSTGIIVPSSLTTLNNLTINNSNGVSLSGPLSTNTLTFNAGILNTTATNLLTITNTGTGSIGGASSTSFVNGPMAWTLLANRTADGTTYSFPVGDGTNYRPLDLVNIRTGATSPVVLVSENPTGALNGDETTITGLGSRNWGVRVLSGNFTNAYVRLTESGLDFTKTIGQSSAQSGTYASVGGAGIGTSITTSSAITNASLPAYFAIGSTVVKTLYSYQSGDWKSSTTWTLDPSGTLWINAGTPTAADNVVILNGRTVSVYENTKRCVSLEIKLGGNLDLQTYTGHDFGIVSGQGTLRLSSGTLPAGSTSYIDFVAPDGGTVEYYNYSGSLPTSQTTYNNLWITKTNNNATSYATVIQSDLTINGNLLVDRTQGSGTITLTIGNNTTARTISIYKDLTVSAGARLLTGTTNAIHILNLYGNVLNNGTIRFTNLGSPDYTADATNGVVWAIFKGSSDNTVVCNGTTDFYRLIVDKGIDQTYSLDISASSSANFGLYGRNDQGGNSFDGGANMNTTWYNGYSLNALSGLYTIYTNATSGLAYGLYYKALYVANGTLKLNTNVDIPSLAQGGQDFNLVPNACLWLNGAIVATTTTTTTASYQAATLYGKIRLSDGSFSTAGSAGVVLGSSGTPVILVEGSGTFDVGGIWMNGSNTVSYIQSGGTTNIRANGEYHSARMMDLSNSSAVFNMSGGTLNFTNGQYLDGTWATEVIRIGSALGNYSVTGGTVNVNLPGTRTYDLNSTAPFYNMNVTRQNTTGTTTLRLGNAVSTTFTILNDLTLGANTIFNAGTNSVNLTVGHNFTIPTGATYTPGTNTTTLNGSGGQVFTNAGTITTGLNNFVLANSSNTNITNNLTIRGYLTINSSCFLNDQGNTISVAGDITNSGAHVSTGTGAIILASGTLQTIGGDGNGVFGNFIVNKTGSYATLSANQSITGNLRLVNRILDINTYNLKLSATSNIYDVATGNTAPTTFGNAKMITTSGQQSDGGLTKAFNATGSFLFPIGSGTAYHPGTITISQTPTTWGDITVRPVAKAHPFAITGNQVLNYYWKVTSNSFTGIQPGSVSHTYHYVAADAGTLINSYVTGVYNPYAWTAGAAAQVDKIANNILFPSVNSIDGEYTAGVPAAFGVLKVFYSHRSGDWNTQNTWSNVDNSPTSADATTFPGPNDPVVIGDGGSNNHVVTISANTKVVGGLKISSGSVLDIKATTGHNFGALPDLKVIGTGTLRIASSNFPAGDFGNFLGSNGGTVEYYTETAPSNIGAAFTLPTTYVSSGTTINIANYCYLTLSPATGKNITLPNTDLLIFKDLSTNVSGTSITGIAQLNNQNNTRTVTVNGNLNVSKGNLQFTNGNNRAQNMVVNGDINISAGATFDVANVNAATNTLTIQGNLINNGTFNMVPTSTRVCNVTFTGVDNKQISGTSAISTAFNVLTVNKGTDRNSILEATVNAFSLNTTLPTALTLTNGTFRLSTPLSITLTTTSSFTIPSSGCLSANIGTINIGAATGDAYDLYLQGRLEVLNAGVVNIGNGSNSNNDIEYAAAGNAEINVSGGTLNVDGQIRRNTVNTLGSLWFTQSGGTITVKGNNFNSTRGMFEVLNSGSRFNVSGGNLVIQRAGSTTYADVLITPENSTVNGLNGGHTLTIGNASTPAAQTFNLNISAPLWNLTVDGTTQNKTASLSVNTLSILHDLTINGNGAAGSGSVFKANDLEVTIGGSLTNNNLSTAAGVDQGGYQAGSAGSTQNTTFTGIGLIKGTGTNLTNFANLIIGTSSFTPAITLGTNSKLQVNNNLTLTSGTLADAGNTISVFGNISNSATHSSPLAPGGGIILANGTKQILSGNGNGKYGNITVNNPSNVDMVCNNTITGQLSLSGGLLYINDYKLTMDVNSSFAGSFSASRMVELNGVLSDQGVEKNFSGSATNFVFPIGSNGKYRPATFTITSSDAGSVKVVPVAFAHPVDNAPTNDQLNYYWRTTTTGFSGLTSSTQIYQYGASDVTGNESNYHGALYHNFAWSDYGTSVINTTNHTITVTRPDLLAGEYTAGDIANFSNKPPLYSVGTGNWSNGNNWSVNPSGVPLYGAYPDGNPVFIQAGHKITMNINNAFAYSVDIVGTLDMGTTSFHNLGYVIDTTHAGTGRLMLQATTAGMFLFPGGNYDRFMASTGTTVELYGATNATLPLKPGNIYKPYQNLDLTGTGIKYMSAENLKISGNLTINDGAKLNNTLFNKELHILGNWLDNNTVSSGFIPGNGLTSFDGNAAQSLTVNAALTENFYDVQMNNDYGLILAGAGNVQVSNVLTLNRGAITTNATNSLTLTNASTSAVVGGSVLSFINGPLRKQISNGSYFTFPVGKTGSPSRYGNIYLSNIVNAGIWEAEYYNDDPTAHTPTSFDITKKKLPISHVSNNEYWRVNGVVGGSANVRLRWDQYSGYAGSSAATRSKIRVVQWNPSGAPSAQWEYQGKVLSDGGDVAGTVATDNIINLAPGADLHYITIGDEGLPTATITSPLTASICNDAVDATTVTVALTGTPPWSLSYKLGNETTTLNNIASSPVSIVLTSASSGITGAGVFNFNITNVNDLTGTPGITDYITTVAVTINAIPSNTITGRTSVGTGEVGVVYTTPADASTYLWSLPSGGTITSGAATNSCTITWGASVGTYTLNLTKTGTNGCAVTNSISVSTSSTPTPVITGSQYVCAGSSQTYSTPNVASHSYTWSLSPAGSGTISGSGNSITVTWNGAATGNSVNVREYVTTNTAIYGNASLPVDIGQQPSSSSPTIVAPVSVCNGSAASIIVNSSESGVYYQLRLSDNSSVGSAVPGNGGSITLNGSAITSNTTYNINAYTLAPFNCNTQLNNPALTFTVNALSVLNYGTLSSGDQTICEGTVPDNITFSAAPSGGSGTYSYQWYSYSGLAGSGPSGPVIPSGWSAISGATSNNYTPPALSTSMSYAVMVTPSGSPVCGTATWAGGCRQITINPLPVTGPLYRQPNN